MTTANDTHAELIDALSTIAAMRGDAARDILKQIKTLQYRLRDALLDEGRAFQRLADASSERAKRRERRRPEGHYSVEYDGVE